MLEAIDLRMNSLKGTVPESLFELSNLERLVLSHNTRLYGSIPASIESATNLKSISFQRCRIKGAIPDTISSLSHLTFVTLTDNEV